MIAGHQGDLSVVPFLESEAGEYPGRLADAIAQATTRGTGAVVFCDLMGWTPFNQAMLIAQSHPGVRVVVGTNLPMLIECCAERTASSTSQQVADCAVSTGQEGVASFSPADLPTATEAAEDEEGI